MTFVSAGRLLFYGEWSPGADRRTETVYKRKVNGRARCRTAAPVEEGLRVEGGAPAEKVYPAKDGGQERKEADHDHDSSSNERRKEGCRRGRMVEVRSTTREEGHDTGNNVGGTGMLSPEGAMTCRSQQWGLMAPSTAVGLSISALPFKGRIRVALEAR